MGIAKWLEDRSMRDLDDYAKKEMGIDSLPPHEHTAYFIGVNTKALLVELRMIRWLLLFILMMMIVFAVHILPDGWWYRPWWRT